MSMNVLEQLQHLHGKYLENPIDALEKAAEMSRFPSATEISLHHPLHRSIVKLRDNGSIDIFAENQNGIRIDRKKLAMNICTGKFIQHVNEIRSFVNGEVKAEVKGKAKAMLHADAEVEVKKDATVTVKGNVTVKSDGTVVIEGKSSVEIKSSGPISISSGGDVSIEASGNMTFSANMFEFI